MLLKGPFSPVLSTNGSTPSFSTLSSYAPQHSQQPSQQQQSMQGQSQPLQSRPPYYNSHPHLQIYPSPYYQQSQSTPQGTMSPQALHTSANGSLSYYSPTAQLPLQQGFPLQAQTQQQPQPPQQIAISQPIASTSQQPMQQSEDQPTGLTAEEREERRRKFLDNIRPLLQPTSLTGAGSVNALTDRISEYGVADVDAPTRLEVLSKIRDGAGNGYYRAWSENMTALDITRDWMKAAAKGTNPAFVDTIMPLLHVSRLLFIKMSAKTRANRLIGSPPLDSLLTVYPPRSNSSRPVCWARS